MSHRTAHCIALRRILASLVLVALLAPAMREAAAQDPFATRRNYRFLPRFSVLNESGGIAGVDVDFRVRGTFEFATRLGETDVWPPQILAEFDNVDAWASHPILAYVLPLDETLSLSDLEGTQIYRGPHGFSLFEFTNKAGPDEVQIDLHVATLGDWFFMRGGTEPPCCDFFEYEIQALAHATPFADFDGDDEVGALDLTRWAQGFGLPAVPPVTALGQGDANGDGAVDGADFLYWQRQQAEEPPPLATLNAMLDAALASAATASFSTIPEPSSAGLALLAALAGAGRLRRHF